MVWSKRVKYGELRLATAIYDPVVSPAPAAAATFLWSTTSAATTISASGVSDWNERVSNAAAGSHEATARDATDERYKRSSAVPVTTAAVAAVSGTTAVAVWRALCVRK